MALKRNSDALEAGRQNEKVSLVVTTDNEQTCCQTGLTMSYRQKVLVSSVELDRSPPPPLLP